MVTYNASTYSVILDNTETEWISKQALHHTLTGSGKVPKKIPKITHEKRSVLPTIEAPHPGTSYNPTYTDHQTLLKDAVEKESKIIKEEAHIHRCTRAMFSKVTEQQKNVLTELPNLLMLITFVLGNVDERNAAGDC